MPLSQRQLDDTFGYFDFHENPNLKGAIIQAADWIEHNLVRIPPPFPIVDGNGKPYKVIACHRLIADQLTAALVEIRDAGLTHLINTWDGCWCARHKTWDPKRGLSSHCWAIAVDVNARLFPYGSTRKQDPRLVAAFARHGFEWGGPWHTPDPMHFEFVGRPSASADNAPISDDERLQMSQLTDWLTKIGVPPQLLSYGQKLINDWKKKAVETLPIAAALVCRIEGNPRFKEMYRKLPPEQRAGVDQALERIAACALETVIKVILKGA